MSRIANLYILVCAIHLFVVLQATAGSMVVTELEVSYNGAVGTGTAQASFMLTSGFVGAPSDLRGYPVTEITVNVSTFSATDDTVVVSAPGSRFSILTPEERVEDRTPLVTFSITSQGQSILDPNDPNAGTGTIAVPVVFEASSFPGLEFGSLNRLTISFSNVKVETTGTATWPFPPVRGSGFDGDTQEPVSLPEPNSLCLTIFGLLVFGGVLWTTHRFRHSV